MNVETADAAVARVASAIGEPPRARMLISLLDGRARTSTELAVIAGVSAATASAHLSRLKAENLVAMQAQGKHRYYALRSVQVARALEGLGVVAGAARARFEPSTPIPYRMARRCYDHLAGTVAVRLLERFRTLRWLGPDADGGNGLELTQAGGAGLAALGVNLDSARGTRRRFAYACLDWSERRGHLAGALGFALLTALVRKQWMEPELDSRALQITARGRREFEQRLQIQL